MDPHILSELQPHTVEVLKKAYADHRGTAEYMLKFGSKFEKAIAELLIAAGGEQNAT